MSQKRTDFQSKPRFGGGKFGGKGKGGGSKFGGGGDRAPRREFDKRFEGDKSSSADRPARGGEGGYAKKPRFGSDRPYDKKKSFGDRPPYKKDGERRPYDKDRKPYGDKPRAPYKKDGERRPYDKDRKPYGDKPFRERAPYNKEGGERRPYDKDRKPYGDKPFRERAPYNKEGGERRPYDKDRKPYGDKPFRERAPYNKESGERRPYDKDRKSFGDKPHNKDRDSRDERRPQKPWQRYGDDRPRSFGKKFDHDRKPRRDFDGDRPERQESAAPASFETREKLKSARASYGAPSSAFLYGVHAVSAALQNPKRVHQRLLCTAKGYESIEEACRKALEKGIKLPEVTTVEKDDIERLLPRDAVHQDVLLDAQPPEEVFLADVLNAVAEKAVVLVLDQVTDPHNVGAILRSAAAFGAVAVVAQKLNAPDITGTLAKVASGAVEHVPLVREVNLSRALEQLKEAGFTCLGLAEEGKRTLSEARSSGRVALVLGAEGEGLRRLVAEHCDELVRLPTQGPIGSLNVSNAAAVALYEVVRA